MLRRLAESDGSQEASADNEVAVGQQQERSRSVAGTNRNRGRRLAAVSSPRGRRRRDEG